MRSTSVWILVLIVIVTVVGGFFIYPSSFIGKVLPWRLGLDLVGGAHLAYEVDMSAVSEADRSTVLEGLRDVLEKRVNLFGVSEPQVVTARSGDSYRINVELAGIKDVEQAINEIGETPFLLFAEVKEVLPAEGETPGEDSFIPTELTGRYITSASVFFDQVTGKPQISLNFNDEGAKIFETLTERNVGKQIAVFLDGNLITAPVVQQKISGGQAQITGNFTPDEARLLVSRFNAGALPAPISLITQQTIGATLGADSLRKTLFAGALGTAFVALFMILYYRTFGVFAALALVIYVVLNLAVFKIFSITMTLAGIAGIVLSIGMAVDANILIFERTKEELKRGVSRLGAIEDGFKRAWLSIRDSNITTIITSVILYYFTTGFIKGFALALLIGVIISMFSAITITRAMMRSFIRN
ncbi:MAG: protein translocase subunit SecD [Patescibacteria group bacterium]|mgnify:CR=1 FL=1